MSLPNNRPSSVTAISFKEAFLFWLKLGFISFGGPAAQIAIMHEYLVEKKRWISESKFLHALNYCMLLPGPEAQQLATYTGWLMHGTSGGVVAGSLFILPSVFILMGLSIIYVTYGQTLILNSIFLGLKPAMVAIVVLALWKIGEKALKTRLDIAVALAALVALLFFKIPYHFVIIGAIVIGFVNTKFGKAKTRMQTDSTNINEDENLYVIHKEALATSAKFSWRRFLFQLSAFLLLWILPFGIFYFFSSDFPFWRHLALFFTQTALFTFGGAYSILVYIAQYSVDHLHWLSRNEMIDGLALGETTPGPLMMVLTFVGFMGTYHHFGSIGLAAIGLLVTTYFTFFPSFVFVLLGAPLIERSQENKTMQAVLSLVTAAIVGVIANLAVFAAEVVLLPAKFDLTQINLPVLIWIIISIIAMKKFKVPMIWWIGTSALVGTIYGFLKG